MKLKKVLSSIIIISLITILIVGCQQAQKPVPEKTTPDLSPDRTMDTPDLSPDRTMDTTPPTAPDTASPPSVMRSPGPSVTRVGTNADECAKNIENQVSNMNEVLKCTTAIMGDTALVGVSLNTGYGPRLTDETANSIMQKVKATDASVKNVGVTESTALYTRINNLKKDLYSDKPTNNIEKEKENIYKNIKFKS